MVACFAGADDQNAMTLMMSKLPQPNQNALVHSVHINTLSTSLTQKQGKISTHFTQVNPKFSFYNVGSCQETDLFGDVNSSKSSPKSSYGCKPTQWKQQGITVDGKFKIIQKIIKCACY